MAIRRLSGFAGEASIWGLREWVRGDTPTAAEFNANWQDALGVPGRALLAGVLAGGQCTGAGLVVTVPAGTSWYASVVWVVDEDEPVEVPDENTTYIWGCSDGVLRLTDTAAPPSGFDGYTACLITMAVASGGVAVVDNTLQHKARVVDVSARRVTEGPLTTDYSAGRVGARVIDIPRLPAAPTSISEHASLYAREADSRTEAFIRTPDGEVQLTKEGLIHVEGYLKTDGSVPMVGHLQLGGNYLEETTRVIIRRSTEYPMEQEDRGCLVVRKVGSVDELFYVEGIPPPNNPRLIQLTSSGKVLADAYLPLIGGTMSGAIAMGANKVTGLAPGTASGEAVEFAQLRRQSIRTFVTSGEFGVTVAYTAFASLNACLDYATADEVWHQLKLFTYTYTARNLRVYVLINNRATSSTVALRANASDVLSLTIPANTSGAFENTNAVTLTPGALVNYRISTGAGSGGFTISLIQIDLESS